MNDVTKRFIETYKSLGLTGYRMGKDCPVITKQKISNIEKGITDVSSEILSAFFACYKTVNPAYILSGEGYMLKEGKTEGNNPVPDQPASPKKRIPFYDDVATVGGTNHLVANNDPQCAPSEWIDAGDWFPEATAAIRHYGDSMLEYPSGSILALKRVEDHRLIIWGRNYSIETTEFRITKRLQDGGDDYIMAYSSNESTYSDGRLIHSPIKIPKETIRHIDLVLGCVTKEYSNGPIRIIK